MSTVTVLHTYSSTIRITTSTTTAPSVAAVLLIVSGF